MTGPTIATPAPPYFFGTDAHILVVSTIASLAAPTLVELQAGTDISQDILAMAGFTKNANNISVARMDTATSPSVAGFSTWADSSLELVADKTGNDQRATFTEGLVTHIVVLEDNFTTDSVMNVYAVKVSTVSQPMFSTNAASFTVNMVITNAAEGLTVPAS